MRVTPSAGHARMSRVCHSTRLSPVGDGRSTTNSVRCAGNTCSLSSTGSPSTSRVVRSAQQHRRADRHLEQLGVGRLGQRRRDRLGRAAESSRRAARRTGARSTSASDSDAPRSLGHHTVTRANGMPVGEVQPPHLEHLLDAEHLAHARVRGHEAEVEDLALGRDAARRRAAPRSCRAGRATGAADRPRRTSRSPAGSRPGLLRAALRAPGGW